MDGSLEAKGPRNHGAIWMVSLLISGALVGLAYFLFAEFEHSSWFPHDWRRFLNSNEALAFGGGGLALWVLLALLMYRVGAFRKAAPAVDAWGAPAAPSGSSVPSGFGAVAPSSASSGSGADFGATGSEATIPVVIQYNRRACTGELVLADRRLYFVCFRDESLAKANAGKAVAHQFGLLGALIHALASRGGSKKKEAELSQVRLELAALSLEERIQRNEYSFSVPAERIKEVSKSTWTGHKIVLEDKKYSIAQMDAPAFGLLRAWCDKHSVPTSGF